LIGINTSVRAGASANRSPRDARLHHLCGIVTQDRLGATLYFAGEFKAFVPVATTLPVAAASHHNHIIIAAQEGAFDLGAHSGQRQRYAA